MTTDANKDAVRRTLAAFESGDLDALDELVAVDVVEHAPGGAPGRESLKQAIAALRAAVPGLRYAIQDLVAEGDLVAARALITGTDTDGKPVRLEVFHLTRFANGTAVEHWGCGNDLSEPARVPTQGTTQRNSTP